MRSYIKQNMLHIVFSSAAETKKYKTVLDSMGFIKFTNVIDNSVFVGVDDNKTAFTAVNKWLLDHDVEFNAIEIVAPSLEDVFFALTDSEEKKGWD
ncbi:hypothetical protein LGL55_18940 [Clostridium tagluense]|uniref:hypothetical protein n=1 Tax=Clostridium tagluense TaxID=360422 RepID=UPI001CF4690E|nr:hypothetical protein [Clostridium tagluense]MCB2311868.1 hypothetical protein [Clostridium tagluense]MCB2317377.1 hypothetical protein [Clostridium tagluense]MCB2322829.1 hypothetical protein [Clostridium tagluense]MCB2326931.1 hypothetical protein [Clostridium tagluense]MCB2332470.1 hypothetical protein [Clostridium tagluense]